MKGTLSSCSKYLKTSLSVSGLRFADPIRHFEDLWNLSISGSTDWYLAPGFLTSWPAWKRRAFGKPFMFRN